MKSKPIKRLIFALLISATALLICSYFPARPLTLLLRLTKRLRPSTPVVHAFFVNGLVYTLVYAAASLFIKHGQKKRILPAAMGFALVGIAGYFLYKNGILFKLRDFLHLRVTPDHMLDYAYAIPAIPVIYFCLSAKSTAQEKTTLYRKEKFYTPDSPFAKLLVFVLLVLWIVGIMSIYAIFDGAASKTPGFTLFGTACLVAAILWTRSMINDARIKSYKKIVLPKSWPADCSYAGYAQGLTSKVTAQTGSKALSFYERCQASGVDDLDNEANRQKALLIAQNMKLANPSLEQVGQLYEAGKAAAKVNNDSANHQADMNQKRAKRIEELHTLEEKMRYFGLHGKEKRVAMLNALRQEALRKAKEAENAKAFVQHTLIQKEHDWAVHGGIASGIAGPAAGVVTALDVQQKNAAIRAQNEANMPLVAFATMHYGDTANGYRAQANHYASLAAGTKDKLLMDQDPQQVFANLLIENAEVMVSETGAVTVEADFTKKDAYRIYESIDPAIDGTVAARLWQNGRQVASAYFVLPVEGVTDKVRLSAISTKPIAENANYTVSFEAVDLWAIESL